MSNVSTFLTNPRVQSILLLSAGVILSFLSFMLLRVLDQVSWLKFEVRRTRRSLVTARKHTLSLYMILRDRGRITDLDIATLLVDYPPAPPGCHGTFAHAVDAGDALGIDGEPLGDVVMIYEDSVYIEPFDDDDDDE